MTQEQRPSDNDEKVGWIDGLARRSAGLPKSESPNQTPSPGKKPEKSPWSYAGIGIQFAATTGLFFLMGLYVDAKFGWSPWATVGFTMLGVVGGLYLLIKDAIKNNADEPPASRKKAKDGQES